jgi:hypothetical protein
MQCFNHTSCSLNRGKCLLKYRTTTHLTVLAVALGSPVSWMPGSLTLQNRENNHAHSSSAEVKNSLILISTFAVYLHGLVVSHRKKFIHMIGNLGVQVKNRQSKQEFTFNFNKY